MEVRRMVLFTHDKLLDSVHCVQQRRLVLARTLPNFTGPGGSGDVRIFHRSFKHHIQAFNSTSSALIIVIIIIITIVVVDVITIIILAHCDNWDPWSELCASQTSELFGRSFELETVNKQGGSLMEQYNCHPLVTVVSAVGMMWRWI